MKVPYGAAPRVGRMLGDTAGDHPPGHQAPLVELDQQIEDRALEREAESVLVRVGIGIPRDVADREVVVGVPVHDRLADTRDHARGVEPPLRTLEQAIDDPVEMKRRQDRDQVSASLFVSAELDEPISRIADHTLQDEMTDLMRDAVEVLAQ